MEGHTQGHIKRNNETFYFVCPKSAIFVPDTQKYPSSRLIHLRYVTKNSLKNKEKTLDYIGRYSWQKEGKPCFYYYSDCLSAAPGDVKETEKVQEKA